MQFKQKRIEEFVNGVRGKKNVYCFGAGTALTNFLHEFEKFHLDDDIKYVVDNSIEKQGMMVHGGKRTIPIISLKQMLDEIAFGEVILITTVHFLEIIKQLNSEEKLRNTECYIYRLLRVEQYDYDRLGISIPESLSVYQEQQIPKIIHYCWFGGKQIPVQYKMWMESWRHFCPDYEIIEWNDKNYDIKKNKYVRQAYEMEKWAFVSDYARVDIVDEYGGVYLDTDVELIKNIDEMLMTDAFCGFEGNKYVSYGLGFGARKHHPIVSEIKEYYQNTNFVLADGTLNQIISTFIQTEIMKRHGLRCNGEFQIVEGMAVYPSRILCGMSPHSYRIQRNLEHTYAIHHFSGSWVEDMKEKNDIIFSLKKWGKCDSYFYAD